MDKQSVNIIVVNHGKVFGDSDFYTFLCGNCNKTIWPYTEKCDSCGAILNDNNSLWDKDWSNS